MEKGIARERLEKTGTKGKVFRGAVCVGEEGEG